MTVDSATMEDMEAKADQLGIQFSSIDLNSSHPPHFNFKYPILNTKTLPFLPFQFLNTSKFQTPNL